MCFGMRVLLLGGHMDLHCTVRYRLWSKLLRPILSGRKHEYVLRGTGQFSEWFGWYINTPIYIFAVCLGAYILFVLIYWVQNRELPFHKKQAVLKA